MNTVYFATSLRFAIYLTVISFEQGRGEKGDGLMNRLKKGREELEWLEEGGASRFDHVLLNDELGCKQSNFQQSLLTIL